MSDITVYQPAQDEQFLALWLYGKSEKTQRAYTADIHKFYDTCGKSLQEVTLLDLHRFVDSLAHLAPTSRNRAIACVKSALSFGVKSGYLRVNVGLLVKQERLEDRLAERIMSEQDMARMLALETNKRNHALLCLLYRGGLRCEELCNLTWRNLVARDDGGWVSVYGKGNKTRQVLLDPATWREVWSLASREPCDLGDYVFQSRETLTHSHEARSDRRLDESTVWNIVRRAAERAGIAGNVSPHWLRHAHATHALENGASIVLVKETLGHASIETTAKYTHVRPNASSGQYLKV